MSFARHQTFYIRANWFSKALEELVRDPRIFSRPNAASRLGIGKNMVESLRFWVSVSNLVSSNRDGMTLTPLGSLVQEMDPFFEKDVTWFLIHYGLVSDIDGATSWYLLFNRYKYAEFDEGQFVDLVIREYGKVVATGSLKRDFDCIVATYVSDENAAGSPEDNITCPLRKLGLLDRVDRGIFRKVRPGMEIPVEVLYYILRSGRDPHHDSRQYRSISDMVDGDRSIGRVFSLGVDEVFTCLQRLEERGLVAYFGNFGQNAVTVDTRDPLEVLRAYYERGLGQ